MHAVDVLNDKARKLFADANGRGEKAVGKGSSRTYGHIGKPHQLQTH